MRFKAALVQMSMTSRPEENLHKAVENIGSAAAKGANVVCLPELFRSLYFCQKEEPENFELAEPVPGPTTEALGKAAKETKTVVITSVFEKRAPGLYHNTAVVIGPDGKLIDTYRKMHIPDDPGYYEKYYFTPGDLGFKSVETPFGNLGILVCWDQWYPEAARLTALKGADIIFYPTAIGWHPSEKGTVGDSQRDAWLTVQRGHAIANGVFVAAVNRVGHEAADASSPGLDFWGTSFISDPFGIVLAQASTDREETVIHEIDTARTEEVRRNWPFLRDRRIDAYGRITDRFSEK